jgi:hypothetical protein
VSSKLLPLVAALAATAALAGDASPEKLLGLSADDEKGQITFVVWASGCAKKADFRVELAGKALTLVRLRPDSCKMMPQRWDLTFTLAEVGLKPHDVFTVTNPFTPNVNEASMR